MNEEHPQGKQRASRGEERCFCCLEHERGGTEGAARCPRRVPAGAAQHSPAAAPCRGGPTDTNSEERAVCCPALPQGTHGPSLPLTPSSLARIKPLGRCVHELISALQPEAFRAALRSQGL